jgi:hypothetical protein
MFRFTQTNIVELSACASLKLQSCNFSEAQVESSLMMVYAKLIMLNKLL